jgi:hypothetical protein
MFFDSDNSKEAIKTRMLRIALNYWDTKNTDELDPLVKLLMEALSAELYDVVNDIKNAEGRILEKMAHILAPDLLTSPTPAHAIMKAVPAEPIETITNEDLFYVEKKIASKPDGPLDTSIDLYFTAVNKAAIFDAQINYVFSGANLYTVDSAANKMLAGNAQKGLQTNECCVWLGMHLHSRISKIGGMRFFFDLKNVDASVADYFYQFLPFTRWYINDREIKVYSGLHDAQRNNTTENGMTNTDLMESIRSNVNNYYQKKFITIADDEFEIKTETLQLYPDKLKNSLPQPVLQKLTDDLVWVKIVFPTKIQQELLDELNVKVNAFPVMNCKPNELRFRLRSGRNIIPLPNVPNERFLAIKSFTDGVTNYKAIPFRKAGDEEVGTYTLRTGGLERFDSRNGREMIQYLLELLRSESAAFSAYGHDFIASTLKEMNQFIALLEQKTNTTISDALEIPNYIIVKPAENQEMMFVEYWTTNMDVANNIRTGTKMQQSSGIAVKPDSLMLLTATMGGKDKLKSEEKLYAFKYGLLTRDRIVTVEDIRSFCFYELGNRLKDVTVKRGFVISDNPKEGAKRTIDVVLSRANAQSNNNEEWEQLCGQLKSKLQTRSGMSYNYRILSKEMV